jgi:hypothetical protein
LDDLQVWGANALPLAISGAPSYGRFLTSRFLGPPYATAGTLEEFSRLFESRPPELILDLHARGDNQFNFPIAQLPALARAIERDYRAWVDPALPWACFYLRKGDEAGARPESRGLCESRCLDSSSEYYPRSLAELRALARFGRGWLDPSAWRVADRLLRILFTLEILRNSCPRLAPGALGAVEERSREALEGLARGRLPAAGGGAGWEGEVRQYFEAHGFGPPYVLDSPGWWASLAVVELQPVARPR